MTTSDKENKTISQRSTDQNIYFCNEEPLEGYDEGEDIKTDVV